MRERRESGSGSAGRGPGAFDPIAGGQGPALAVALVIGRSASERESVARAMHREQRGPDGPFLRIDCRSDEGMIRQALQSWLVGSRDYSPQFLNRLESGSLFLDEVEALGIETQSLLLDFLNRVSGAEGDLEGASEGPSQPWKGQLIAGSAIELRRAVRDRGYLSGLAERLEMVRIVLDPDEVDPRES